MVNKIRYLLEVHLSLACSSVMLLYERIKVGSGQDAEVFAEMALLFISVIKFWVPKIMH